MTGFLATLPAPMFANLGWLLLSLVVHAVVIGIPVLLIFGEPTPIVGDLMLGAGWLINLMVAQWAIGRSRAPTRRVLPVGV